jgi:hypothetical protein
MSDIAILITYGSSVIFMLGPLKDISELVFFLLGDCPASEFYMLTFRNTVCSVFIVGVSAYTAYEDGTECSEMSAHKIQMLGNHTKERIQHSEHSESFKSRISELHRLILFLKYSCK